MGKYIRKKIGELNRLKERLKYPVSRIACIMQKDFSDDDFLSLFKTAYPGLWIELEVYYKSCCSEYKNRLNKGLKTVKPISPKDFLFSVANTSLINARRNNVTISIEQEHEKNEKRLKIINRREHKLEIIQKKESQRLRKFQEVEPPYIKNLIKQYFRLRKVNPLDIDIRYLIILECAKFKCNNAITFLQKINACEKNDELRELAYQSLVRFGLHPRLTRKRKGKKKLTTTAIHEISENPTTLLQLIFEKQQLVHKKFDIFLSHSYGRKKELLKVKDILNQQGLVVYVDWINDAEMLRREKQNDDTFKVLYERLRQSSALIFIQTELSIQSKYCMDELSYFKELNRPMFMYEAEPVETKPDILNEMIKINLENDKFLIENGDGVELNDKILKNYLNQSL